MTNRDVTPELRSQNAPLATAPTGAATAPASVVDPVEFAKIFRQEAPLVWRVLRRLGIREADLDDLCQDVFVVVYQRWFEFRGESSLRTWIYGIAVRKAIGHRRRKHVRDGVALEPEHEPTTQADQSSLAEQGEQRRMLQDALDALPDGKREVFVLYELEELPMREVAALLSEPMHTCYSRLYSARADLAALLRRAGEKGALR